MNGFAVLRSRLLWDLAVFLIKSLMMMTERARYRLMSSKAIFLKHTSRLKTARLQAANDYHDWSM